MIIAIIRFDTVFHVIFDIILDAILKSSDIIFHPDISTIFENNCKAIGNETVF